MGADLDATGADLEATGAAVITCSGGVVTLRCGDATVLPVRRLDLLFKEKSFTFGIFTLSLQCIFKSG